jgi:hypothetical protein
VRIEDSFHVNPKIVGLSLEAVGLYALALSYCAQQLTDGHVPGGWAKTHGGSRAKRVISELLEPRPPSMRALWVAEGRDYVIPDYLEFQPAREQVLRERSEISAKRAEAGRRGAQARWGKDNRIATH